MKNTKALVLIVALAVLLLAALLFFVLRGGSEPVALVTPTVILNNDMATWSADELAEKFEISLDGELSFIENSMTSKKLSNGQTFKIRAIGDGVNYLNSGWSVPVTYVIQIAKYTVTWKNGDTILETDTDVPEGSIPTFDGAEPTKPADAEYLYLFNGWSPEVCEVSGDITYIAQFVSVPKDYTIVWKNGDIVMETDENVAYGTIPTYDGATPTKDSSAQFTYTFDGWTPQVSPATESVTYQAKFVENVRTYTVTFYSEDGSIVLDVATVKYGDSAVYSKLTPVKNATEEHTFVFEKWVTSQGGSVADDLTNVVGDREVYASFKMFVRTVTVYIVSNNTDYGTVSQSVINNVPIGAAITVKDNAVTINGENVVANENATTAQYTYAFLNWTTPTVVGSDTIVTANFSRTINCYTVTWKNGNTVLQVDKNVAYGTTPVYNGELPTKESDGDIGYTFSGWNPAVSAVTGDITYIAQFVKLAGSYIVTFYDDAGTSVLAVVTVESGETAIYPYTPPTKDPTASTVYTFDKWVASVNGNEAADLTNVTQNMSVYAKYSSEVRKYSVKFCDWDGTLLEEQLVEYGRAATTPAEPYREGYRFDKWNNTAYDNIMEDMIISATYVRQVTVKFVDYDNSVIDIQVIDYGSDAIKPGDPVRNNYTFVGWNTTYTNVVDDLTVKAQYIRQYTVTFVDYDGTVLKTQVVNSGDDAIAPMHPTRAEYNPNGWDKEYTNVTANITVTALYKIKTFTVTFKLPDGTIIPYVDYKGVKHFAQIVEYGSCAEAPNFSDIFTELYFDWNKTSMKKFSGWDKDLTNVTHDLVITAEYNDYHNQPVVVIEQVDQNISVKIYMPDSTYLYALDLGFDWTGSIGISDYNVDETSNILYLTDNSSKSIDYNNKQKTFRYSWICAKGVEVPYNDEYFDVIEIVFSTSGGSQLNIESIQKNCTLVFGEASDLPVEQLTVLSPIVVVK